MNNTTQENNGVFSYDKAELFISKVSVNLKSEVIHTTKDKLELSLIKYEKVISSKYSWSAPLGICSSAGITLLTTEQFNAFLGIEPIFWKSLITMGLIISFVWFLYSLYRFFIDKKSFSIDTLIKDIIGRNDNSH